MKDYDKNMLLIQSNPTLKIYKSNYYDIVQKPYILKNPLPANTKLIVGDDVFEPKNIKKLTSQELIDIYTTAINLKTDNDNDLLDFITSYGLPVSDCQSHIERYSSREFFKNYFKRIQPILLDNTGEFADVYPLKPTRTNLYIFQKFVLLKTTIDQQKEFAICGTDIEKKDNLRDIFDLLLSIMFRFDKLYFYPSVHSPEKTESHSGNFIKLLLSGLNIFSEKLSISDITEKMIDFYKNETKSDVILNSYLNTKQSLQLIKLLETALSITQKNKCTLADYCYSATYKWSADDIFMYYIDASRKRMTKEDIISEILSTAEVFFYDLLNDILLDCPRFVSKATNKNIEYSVKIPSLLHGLYYMLYTNPSDRIKVCENCHSYFLSSSRKSNAKYCCDSCGNLSRVKKHRTNKSI